MHQLLVYSSKDLKGIVIANNVSCRYNLPKASIVVFLTIYLAILKLVLLGFKLHIRLV
jgi:hypothetical protein